MKITYELQFLKDLEKIQNRKILKRVRNKIEDIKSCQMILDISGIKKLSGHNSFYRIRIGDYRIGFELKEEIVIMARILHRKEVYRFFPDK